MFRSESVITRIDKSPRCNKLHYALVPHCL